MKKLFSALARILPHTVLILSMMLLVFFCIDQVNPSMAFLNSSITKYLLAICSVMSVILAVHHILNEEKNH